MDANQHPIGFPEKDPAGLVKAFRNPPPGYGEVAFFWWLGDPLTKERLTWQLDQLKGKGIMGLQINYAHSDAGGQSYGFTYPSDPPLFSEKWWSLVKWFIQEAKKRGMAVSLSDYTLGIGQGWAVDDALMAHPELAGSVLESKTLKAAAGQKLDTEYHPSPLCVTAFSSDGKSLDLLPRLANNRLVWSAPEGADWTVVAVWARRMFPSIDPMNPISGKAIVEKFFQPFEDRNPGEAGKGLNFFFSDELGFGLPGRLWDDRFAAEFQKRKGYDIRPELALLFADGGPRTPKVRLDYSDVMVSLSEEGYFKPVYDWHQQRGMIYGCDHGGRGRDVTEFGDYFRTQKWNQGPGCDQPALSRDLVKNKVASSISHLYERPRVWLEGYHSSGWSTSSGDVVDATIANFLEGQNLLTFHGLYYSTHGGWWEWAPPDNHWRNPYWQHMDAFYGLQQRLSYLLTQGTHVADVAVLYPVAPVEAGMGGGDAVSTAFDMCEGLYGRAIDLDFMDFQSLDRSSKAGGRLGVAGESYRVLVLPSMKAVRHSTLTSALEFVQAGGIVVAVGSLPEASDRAGRNDPEVARLVTGIFGVAGADGKAHRKLHPGGGLAFVLPDVPQAVEAISQAIPRDIEVEKGAPSQFMHRRIGKRDVYSLYGAEAAATFHATGRAELWDPWTGNTRALPVVEQRDGSTKVRLPLSHQEVQIVVFSPGAPAMEAPKATPKTTVLPIEGVWRCEPKPVLDNRWGDFHWPPTKSLIGPEARRFRYHDDGAGSDGWMEPGFDDSAWQTYTCGFGPKFLVSGPMTPQQADAAERELLGNGPTGWRPYDFSWQWGVEGDRGHQGYHGLKENVSSHFIRLGKKVIPWPGDPWTEYAAEDAGPCHYLWTAVLAPKPMQGRVLVGGMQPDTAWLNGKRLGPDANTVELKEGRNPLILRFGQPGTGYFAVVGPAEWKLATVPDETHGTLAMPWLDQPGVLPFDPGGHTRVGWFRFGAPPGLKSLEVPTKLPVKCWVGGKEIEGHASHGLVSFALPKAIVRETAVCLRVEQLPGEYAGCALTEPIRFECGEGEIALGDWSQLEGLRCYSGGMWYRKKVSVPAVPKGAKVYLDLGNVISSAEVRVNGQPVGVKISPPWKWDVTSAVRQGENQVDVLVYNTLANHYLTIPTGYRGATTSGILGPTCIEVAEQ